MKTAPKVLHHWT